MEYLLPDLQRAGAPALGLLAGVVFIGTALFEAFEVIVPAWVPEPGAQDNWETTAWDLTSPAPLLGPNSPFASDPCVSCFVQK
jgi:hypothetical protein